MRGLGQKEQFSSMFEGQMKQGWKAEEWGLNAGVHRYAPKISAELWGRCDL